MIPDGNVPNFSYSGSNKRICLSAFEWEFLEVQTACVFKGFMMIICERCLNWAFFSSNGRTQT
jgi:hypothetical protein